MLRYATDMTVNPDVSHAAMACDTQRRVAALARYSILDTPPDSRFDDLVRVAAHVCQAPISVINFIDSERQWFKAEVGLGVTQMPLDVSICLHVLGDDGEVCVIEDTRLDPRMANNPLVLGEPSLQFYAGALLRADDGEPIGTLCVLDYQPRQLTAEQVDLLRVLGRQVMLMLELMRANAEQASMLQRLQQARDQLEQLASTDSLTGLANRRAGMQRLRQELALAQRRQMPPTTLLMIDLDRFKSINDQYGHSVGDQALKLFAQTVLKVVRQTDLVARWGGEEFLVIMPDASIPDALKIAARLHEAMAGSPLSTPAGEVVLTASIGVVGFDPQQRLEDLLQLLDARMYSAKASGGGLTHYR